MDQRPKREIQTLKWLEENIHSALHDKSVGEDTLTRTPFVQKLRSTIEK